MIEKTCNCYETEFRSEYYGSWIKCECGYDLNTKHAIYCGRCGKKIRIIGTISVDDYFDEEDDINE